jgi:hypothetical protein
MHRLNSLTALACCVTTLVSSQLVARDDGRFANSRRSRNGSTALRAGTPMELIQSTRTAARRLMSTAS